MRAGLRGLEELTHRGQISGSMWSFPTMFIGKQSEPLLIQSDEEDVNCLFNALETM